MSSLAPLWISLRKTCGEGSGQLVENLSSSSGCGVRWRRTAVVHSSPSLIHKVTHRAFTVNNVVKGASSHFPQGLLLRTSELLENDVSSLSPTRKPLLPNVNCLEEVTLKLNKRIEPRETDHRVCFTAHPPRKEQFASVG